MPTMYARSPSGRVHHLVIPTIHDYTYCGRLTDHMAKWDSSVPAASVAARPICEACRKSLLSVQAVSPAWAAHLATTTTP